MSLEKLYTIAHGLNRRFPEGNDPFQKMPRLLDESDELAQMVNHFEGTGINQGKYGSPDKTELSKEVKDLLRCTLQIAIYYGVEDELENKINGSYEKMRTEGLIRE